MNKKALFRHAIIFVFGVVMFVAFAAYGRAKDKDAVKGVGDDSLSSQPEFAAPGEAAGRPAEQPESEPVASKVNAVDPYWIGVRCVAPVPEIVLAQVDVPEDSGVFVVDVVADGPAAKAGVARHDIILSAVGKSIKTIADLVAAVDRSQGKPLAIEILRAGKPQTVEITPQRRPAEFGRKASLEMPPGSRWRKLGQWFDDTLPGIDGRAPLRMQFMHPGIILPPGTKNNPPLPKDIKEAVQSRFQEQLEVMDRQMRQLRKLTDELRQERLLLERQKESVSKTKTETKTSQNAEAAKQ